MSTGGATSRSVDVYVVGLGIMAAQHLTREAEQAVRRSNRTFFVDGGFGTEEFLASLCRHVHPVMGLYHEGGDRRRTYQEMAARVLDAALTEAPVCFATYGHPYVYVHPTRLIQEGARLLDLTVRVLPGVSALDTIMIDLGLDPGPQGLQMYEATDLLARERPLRPDVPCLLWQVSAVESALFTTRRGTAERFSRLQDYLLRTYPRDHQVTMVLSASYELLGPHRETFALGELAAALAAGTQGGTLYIPPVAGRRIHDADLLRDVHDPVHLARVTVPR